jgi:hypothetical protein
MYLEIYQSKTLKLFLNLLKKNGVNDRWIFISIYPCIAVLLAFFENNQTFPEILKQPDFYSDFLLCLFCTFILGIYIKLLYVIFQLKTDLKNNLKSMLPGQFIFGVFTPLMIVMGFSIFYETSLLHISLENTAVFYIELPLVFTVLIVLNLIYTLLYFKKHFMDLQKEV